MINKIYHWLDSIRKGINCDSISLLIDDKYIRIISYKEDKKYNIEIPKEFISNLIDEGHTIAEFINKSRKYFRGENIMNDLKFYTSVLKSEECQCGRNKKRGMALCYNCFKELPNDMQRNLYNRLNSGFQEAYEEAVKYLNE